MSFLHELKVEFEIYLPGLGMVPIDFTIHFSIENASFCWEGYGLSGTKEEPDRPEIQKVSWDESLFNPFHNRKIKEEIGGRLNEELELAFFKEFERQKKEELDNRY